MAEELEYDFTLHTSNKGDEGLYVEIFLGEIQNAERSLEEGRPIYDQVETIRITVPGDRNNVVERPLRPEDRARFPRQYAQFKRGEQAMVSGTPIATWPLGGKALAAELMFFGIHTVEQLATASDANVMKFPGLINLKAKAVEFIEATKAAAPAAKVAELTQQNVELSKQLEELRASVAALTAAKVTDGAPAPAPAPAAKAPATK